MIYNTDYTNKNVLIRDGVTGETIAQSKIIEYNKKQLSIFVNASEFAEQLNCPRLSLLIFVDGAIHIYGGVPRKSYNTRRYEISMFQGKEHDDRNAKRYPSNIDAKICNIIYSDDNETVDKTFNVKVLNVSTHGVLIEVNEDIMEVNDNYSLCLNISGIDTIIKCLVVRRAGDEGNSFKYGCRFLAVENKSETG